ncbi:MULTISPECIES: shikimate dehydrogenase [unclassified Streptomyces]|uniref:shikimate dehydrogenase n=1 Tax=unclassified Streptomyces TaxID=2593676 RepID=UPI002DD880FC|nr:MULTISPECIES: shikimate dehydrogenase [unclassified Streptomyces]WSA91697.1 shikimate dehydrogenase [Streptomyces sp. NBC_01795]WSB76071.1 shikimate dehydrogenase [Streptomyces sp. NBC_01775]WSS15656.1 shikimate dehydrogenase [Streptomyces sp. NBC_01186]WSS44498.1 shikimate dehydrogenase [Streptomyces sp. NBC_01187]
MTTPPPAPSYLTGLIGTGIGTSLSPALHEREGDRHGLRLLYRTLDLAVLGVGPEALGELLRSARTLGFDGLNITHPCKQAVTAHLDELAPEAARLGAVNTVVFRDGLAVGHNTDVTGFAQSFARGLPGAPTGSVVQLGAGGAGAAVAHALLTLGTDRLTVADTDEVRAAALARALGSHFGKGRAGHISPAGLERQLAHADGLVHATPTGMAAHPGLPLPVELLRPELWVAEVVYRPLETALLRTAEGLGCRTLDGGGMAVFQAADAFRLFTGREPHPERMLADFADLTGGMRSPRGTA